MPATEEEPIFDWNSNELIFGWNSNGGRNLHRRKLLVGEKVEVKSVEEWFLGSWHSAIVISSKKRLLRSIRYDHILSDDAETWECRGRWMFLELVEEYEEDKYLPVSVKQLWYDIRVRVGFAKIREWTCSTRHLWEVLMMEVIEDNLKITINQFLHQEFELVKGASQAVNETDACPSGVEVIAPQEQQFYSNDKDHKRASHRCTSMSGLTSVSGIRSEESYINGVTELYSQKSTADYDKVVLSKKLGIWQPFDCVSKSCPQSVSSYIRAPILRVAFHVRKHLKYMGWILKHILDEGGRQRFRYLSPDGRLNEKSLRQVCIILKQRDKPLTPPEVAHPLSPPCKNWKYNTLEMRSIVLAFPAINRNVAHVDGRKSSAETLLECGSQGKDEVFNRKSKRALYVGLETETKAQGFARLRSKRNQKPNLRHSTRENKVIVGLRDVNLSRRRGQTSRMLTDIKNRVTGRGKARVSRSSKRVQRVINPTSRNQSPHTILSWLVDNNVLLPRENIRYRNQKDHTVRKEGKLTREGIKCSCYRRIFSISGFEAHANGESCRVAANIFLDDGRSLLECQVEAYKTRKKKAQPPNLLKIKLRHGENDIVCSVCHYGGKLILCDGCPSAFHANCLGLEDVPYGDWFCASCCCDACGQFIVKNTSKYAKEEIVISCKQCERKYHLAACIMMATVIH